MPLTDLQRRVLRLLASNRSPGSHLAGGAAIHRAESSLRYSGDLDFFHDSEDLVADAFARDVALLERNGYQVCDSKVLPGFVRASVSDRVSAIRVEWARDSAFRFMPPLQDPEIGYLLHPVDLAVNKVLALAGREESRDLVDTLYVHENVLGLGALCWAAAGKDPGFSPSALVEMLRTKGPITATELRTLDLMRSLDPADLKRRWTSALGAAARFVQRMPAEEIGCLYYNPGRKQFVQPELNSPELKECVRHFGRPGGVIPQLTPPPFVFADEDERRRLVEGFRPQSPPPFEP
ncbi:MAG: hypothetical protein ACREFX_14040 [Opitutaceae bacterium]